MSDLTLICQHFVPDICNHRLRFGVPQKVTKLDNYRSVAAFSPDNIFGYIRWQRNQYGTTIWRLVIAKTVQHGRIQKYAGILPGAHILVNVSGVNAVKQALTRLDYWEIQAGGELLNIPETRWRHFQNGIIIRSAPRPVRSDEIELHAAFKRLNP
ncbi:DUF2840 domain-containing protein [bacterium AH-315-J23]|nr:DUF2840 domain-containing protein [bacterium AH-315-J23]